MKRTKPTAKPEQVAPRSSTRYFDRYLNEVIDFGGIPCTRAEAIREMLADGLTQPEVDRWLQGYELGCRIRARYDVESQVAPTPTRPRVKP